MAKGPSLVIIYTQRATSDAIAIKDYLLYKFTQREVDSFYELLRVFEGVVTKFPDLYSLSPTSKNIRRAV